MNQLKSTNEAMTAMSSIMLTKNKLGQIAHKQKVI